MLSARGSDELRAVVLSLKLVDRTIRNDVNRATRATLAPVWRDAVARHARTPMDRAVLAKGARVAPGNPPRLIAASSRRKLRGGLVPAEDWRAWEFGAGRGERTYRRRSPRGGTHSVTRDTTVQTPRRAPRGRVAYRALGEFAPRAAALWVQLVVKRYADAMEGRA